MGKVTGSKEELAIFVTKTPKGKKKTLLIVPAGVLASLLCLLCKLTFSPFVSSHAGEPKVNILLFN
jgi:hypothetical protein